MVPESWQASKVLLYRAVEFPKRWELTKVLIDDFVGVDSILLKHNDMWWMLTTDRNKGSSQNLNLFYADDLFSDWIPHQSNPIKSDVRSSRSAGKPFVYNDKLYRPSMNYAEKNEGSITLNLVTHLTKKRYSEIVVKEILPYSESDFHDKTHHLFGMKNYTLIDGCKEVCVLCSFSMIRHLLNLVLSRIFKFLKDKKTKMVLYVYDSMLFDFSLEDGKETLQSLKKLISSDFPIKLKKGSIYSSLEAL